MEVTRTVRTIVVAALLCALGAVSGTRSASVVTAATGNISIAPLQDTYLALDKINYSTATTLSAYTWPDYQNANTILMKFSLSAVPAGSVIADAKLYLALVGADQQPEPTYTMTVHKVIELNPDLSRATGYLYNRNKSWSASNCCYNGIPLGESNISPAYDTQAIDKTPGYKTWNVTQLVQDWLANPSRNYGLLLNADPSKSRDHYRSFASARYATTTLRPVLVITLSNGDTTPPAVAITAPTPGATVSATYALKATASDNVGVVGVQFQLNGQAIGSEATVSPYTVNWNTTTVANGSYTLTAVARDLGGNKSTATATVNVSNSSGGGTSGSGIAANFPGDAGIENDPSVLFVERFDESSLTNLFGRWTDILNGPAMTFTTDVPSGSSSAHSLNIPWTAGGANSGGHLYRQLLPGANETLYVRYYIKYPANGRYTHTGIWMGGYNPPLAWPNPQAGVKPAGNDRFSASAEQNTQTNRFDHYDYWMGMRQSADGNYWGNLLLNNPGVQATAGQWTCVEHMVKLNYPVTASNGEHAIWLNGVKVSHLGQGFPNGSWSGGIFTQDPNGSPFQGFQWRNNVTLNLNWIWLQVYAPSDPSNGSIKFANVVAATSRVGCLAGGAAPPPPPPADTIAPTVSLTSPAAGTISGTVTVSANASDNVGVAGVQFKLDGANLGTEDTAAPYSLAWVTTSVADGSHTLTAVARDAAGNIATASTVAVNVSNASAPAGSWPNEPAGFRVLSDQPWNALTGNGWNWLLRSSSIAPSIVSDAAAPFSPAPELQIAFTPSMSRDSEPSVHWMGLSQPREIYTAWWMKLSPNWTPSPAGGGKITFLWAPNGQGQVYSNIGGSSAPHRININTEWAPYGQNFWEPNVTTTPINYGQRDRIEWYVNNESSPGAGDGVMRWWVNGALNGDHRNVRFPACCFQQFEFAPTLQNPPPATQYMWIDHTRVSTP